MSQPLQLSFQANTDQARNAIAQLAGTVTSNMVTIGKTMKDAYGEHEKLTNVMTQLPSVAGRSAIGLVALGAAVITAGAAFALFEKAASAAADQVKKLQDIQKGSTDAGISSTFYQDQVRDLQRFGMTAEEAAKSLIKARQALSPSVDQSGGLQEAGIAKTLQELQKSGFEQLNAPVNRLLGAGHDDIETRTKAARDAMKALHDAAEATGKVNLEALADQIGKALGYSQDATNEVKRLGDASREAGNNFDEGLVKQSKELDQKIADIHLKLANDLQPIMSDLARLGLAFKDALYGTLSPIEDMIGAIGRAYGKMKDLANERDRFGEGGELTIPGAKQSFRTPAARRGVAGRLAPGSTQDLAEGTGDAQTEASLEDRTRLHDLPGPGAAVPVPLARPPDLGKKEPKEAADPTEALDTYMDTLKKSVSVLEAEVRTFGLSNTAKARDVDLTKAQDAARRDAEDGKRTDKNLTEEETRAVLAQADAEGKAKDRIEQLQRAQAAANEQAQLLGSSLISALDKIGEKGAKATDVIKDMVKALIKAVEQALILGTGPFANLFNTQGTGGNPGGLAGLAIGGLGRAFGGGYGAGDYAAAAAAAAPGAYGPGFAGGGMVGRDGTPTFIPFASLINAKQFAVGGGIPSILHPGELVLNAAQQKNVVSNMMGGPKINLTHAPVINGTGLSKEEVFSVIQRSQKEFSRQIGPIFSDWQRRFAFA